MTPLRPPLPLLLLLLLLRLLLFRLLLWSLWWLRLLWWLMLLWMLLRGPLLPILGVGPCGLRRSTRPIDSVGSPLLASGGVGAGAARGLATISLREGVCYRLALGKPSEARASLFLVVTPRRRRRDRATRGAGPLHPRRQIRELRIQTRAGDGGVYLGVLADSPHGGGRRDILPGPTPPVPVLPPPPLLFSGNAARGLAPLLHAPSPCLIPLLHTPESVRRALRLTVGNARLRGLHHATKILKESEG